MTHADIPWEFGKYGIVLLLGLGLLMRKDVKKKSMKFTLFFLLLLPAILLTSTSSFNFWRQAVSFNLSGPLCLTVAAIYFYKRKLILRYF